jgi:hypothetical protein
MEYWKTKLAVPNAACRRTPLAITAPLLFVPAAVAQSATSQLHPEHRHGVPHSNQCRRKSAGCRCRETTRNQFHAQRHELAAD